MDAHGGYHLSAVQLLNSQIQHRRLYLANNKFALPRMTHVAAVKSYNYLFH